MNYINHELLIQLLAESQTSSQIGGSLVGPVAETATGGGAADKAAATTTITAGGGA